MNKSLKYTLIGSVTFAILIMIWASKELKLEVHWGYNEPASLLSSPIIGGAIWIFCIIIVAIGIAIHKKFKK